MSCDACVKPCERSGLLGAVQVPNAHQPLSVDYVPPRRRIISFPCICTLIAIAAVTCLVTFSPKEGMTSEKQVALLNSETKHAMSSSDVNLTGCRSTVVLMRHCEWTDENGESIKDEKGNMHCSPVGKQRARYIATLFGNNTEARWHLPHKMYAMARGREGETERLNYREIETLAPLRHKAEIEIDARFPEGTERLLAKDYFQDLASGEHCGRVTVVIWKDKSIPTMALSLGCGPAEGCPEKYKTRWFDKVWQLSYRWEEKSSERELKKHKKHKNKTLLVEGWNVKGKVVKEHFNSTTV